MPPAETKPQPLNGQLHTSVILQTLIDEAPKDFFTLNWLIGSMPGRSFGVIILFLGLLTMVPIVSIFARLVLLLLILQIMAGYASPALPRRLMRRRIPSRYLVHLKDHAIPTLEYLERLVRPRWTGLPGATRRVGGCIVLVLIIISLLAPLPLANMPVAAIIIMLALAYMEHDGVLLVIAHTAGVMILAVLFAAILEAARI